IELCRRAVTDGAHLKTANALLAEMQIDPMRNAEKLKYSDVADYRAKKGS
ncbi:hypothetical protein NPIL_574931, partial [Nephila pilipes]